MAIQLCDELPALPVSIHNDEASGLAVVDVFIFLVFFLQQNQYYMGELPPPESTPRPIVLGKLSRQLIYGGSGLFNLFVSLVGKVTG